MATTLGETIQALYTLDPNDTIYAVEPWDGNSIALVTQEPSCGGHPTVDGLQLGYFLEVDVAQDFLEHWMRSLNIKPSLEAKVERLVQYAINDA